MEISSVASQALALRDQLTNTQLGIIAVKMEAQSQQAIANLLSESSKTVQQSPPNEAGKFSTYA